MSIRNVPSRYYTIATRLILGMFNFLSFRLEIAADEISNLHTSVTKVFAVVQKLDQKMDALNPEDTQRSLPRASPIDRRLTVNNSQSQSQ